MNCPVCEGENRLAFSIEGYGILECMLCGHRCADLRPGLEPIERIYSDDYFYGGKAGYADYPSEASILREQGQRYARLVSKYASPGSLLDVGAAAGFILEGFRSCGWGVRGLEPNARMGALANERLGPVVTQGTLEGWVTDETFDLVVMIQVISHLRDLRRGLAVAASCTKPGGFWLVETWNRASWTARAFGKRWHEYSPPSVLHWFSPEGLAQLCGGFGFQEVKRGRPPRWIDFGHAKSLLGFKLGSGLVGSAARPLLALFPDHWRLRYPGDDIFWMLLRKTDDKTSHAGS